MARSTTHREDHEPRHPGSPRLPGSFFVMGRPAEMVLRFLEDHVLVDPGVGHDFLWLEPEGDLLSGFLQITGGVDQVLG